ncbi:MAG TPA: glycoside hydrolase family 36 protein [Rectinemataceae bacterium]|nr:glycoside hydrolase family 36 protein [Rectinemataceae bacterium]
MLVDSRFKASIGKKFASGEIELTIAAAGAFRASEIVVDLLSIDFGELSSLLGFDEEGLHAFSDTRSRFVFSNGWQSWSFAGELTASERVPPAILIEGLNAEDLRPGPREARGEVLSHFFTRIRAGDDRILVISLGAEELGRGAPVAFRIDRRTLALSVEIQARGMEFREGETVARLAVARCAGVFAERDLFGRLFGEDDRFARLDFLGSSAGLVPGGYESWYNHYTSISEKVILSDLDSLTSGDNLINAYYIRRGKPAIFQIDDGWEEAVGDWSAHPEKFPGGMAALARGIEARGLVPGLWIAPFIAESGSRAAAEHSDWLLRDAKGRPVVAGWNNMWTGDFYAWDLSNRDAADWIESLIETIVEEWGYRYIKLDFLYAGLLEGERREGGAAWQHYERILSRITRHSLNRNGLPVAWLGCGAPLESSYGYLPLMRIGADTKETWEYWLARLVRRQGRPAARVNLLHTIGRAVLDGSVFVNDPDVIFCRTKGMGYGGKEKELIAAVARMFASQVMFSDDASTGDDPQALAFTKRVIGLYDRLAGLEFGATRIGRNLFSVFERQGRMTGWINLGDRPRKVTDPDAALRRIDPELPFHARRISGGWIVEGRSITVFEEKSP